MEIELKEYMHLINHNINLLNDYYEKYLTNTLSKEDIEKQIAECYEVIELLMKNQAKDKFSNRSAWFQNKIKSLEESLEKLSEKKLNDMSSSDLVRLTNTYRNNLTKHFEKYGINKYITVLISGDIVNINVRYIIFKELNQKLAQQFELEERDKTYYIKMTENNINIINKIVKEFNPNIEIDEIELEKNYRKKHTSLLIKSIKFIEKTNLIELFQREY